MIQVVDGVLQLLKDILLVLTLARYVTNEPADARFVATSRADAHAVPSCAACPAPEPAGHADLFGGAPTTLGRDRQAVHSLSCIRIAGEQALDGVQVAVIRRGAELQVGGIRPKRRAVGGRHEHAFHHVLDECLSGAPRLRRQPGCGPPAEDTRRSGKERNHADGRKDADAGKHDESCGALRKEEIGARDREEHEDEGSHCGKARARRSHRLVPPGPVVLHQYSPPGRI